MGVVQGVNTDPIKWVMQSNFVPIVQSIGETQNCKMVPVDISQAVAHLTKCLQPLKVLLVNTTGGIHNDKGEVSNTMGGIHDDKGEVSNTMGRIHDDKGEVSNTMGGIDHTG